MKQIQPKELSLGTLRGLPQRPWVTGIEPGWGYQRAIIEGLYAQGIFHEIPKSKRFLSKFFNEEDVSLILEEVHHVT